MSAAAPPVAQPVAQPVSPSDTSESGVGTGIRVAIGIIIAMILAIAILLWEAGLIPNFGIQLWMGNVIFLPLIATVLAFGTNSLVQQLSCSQVQWLNQLIRVAIVPVPFIALWALLYFVPSIRWPIEGLIQRATPQVRKAISTGFYTFWTALYTESILINLSQVCPK
jgi:hypothetical protein